MSRSDIEISLDGEDWATRAFVVTWDDDDLADRQIRIRINGTTAAVGTVEGVRAFAQHLLDTADHVEAGQ